MIRLALVVLGIALTAALGIVLHGDPLIGAGVALLAGGAYALGHLDAERER